MLHRSLKRALQTGHLEKVAPEGLQDLAQVSALSFIHNSKKGADIEYFSPETGWKPILHCSPDRRAMIRVHLKAPSRTHRNEATA